MSFLYPSFLFALSAISIPIIIHLFNFRKFKTVYFSNVRFLKEVKEETQAKSKLKHLLVLAARILAITFIVLAFAQPFIPVKNNTLQAGDHAVSIFIDNSFSMEAINENGTLLDEAKKRALEIISSFKPTDRFQLLTNDFEGRHQRLVNKEEFTTLLDEVKISPATKTLAEIAIRQKDVLHAKNKLSFIISDFQKSNFKDLSSLNDSSIVFNFVQLTAAEKNNVYIDSCWFETPVRQFDQLEKLHVRIKNVSDKDLENNSIKLFINDVQKTPNSFNVSKESDTEVIFSFTTKRTDILAKQKGQNNTGFMHCRVEINDFPITFDNTFYFSFEVAKNIPVLCINTSDADSKTPENPYLNKLFNEDSLFVFKNVKEKNLDYSTLSNNTLIILNELKTITSGLAQELKRFMSNGGSLLIFPNPNADLNSYKDLLTAVKANYYEKLDSSSTKVEKINLDDMIYKDVFDKKTFTTDNLYLPSVNKHFTLSKTTRSNEEYLLKLQNGDVFLSKYDVDKARPNGISGRGKLYLSSVPLKAEFSNFTKHALFVPTLYQIAIYSQNVQPLFYTIGDNSGIESGIATSDKKMLHIKSINTNFDLIPEHKMLNSKTEINVQDQIKEAGNYNLLEGEETITGFAFNFNRSESDLTCPTSDELKEEVSNHKTNNIRLLKTESKSLKAYLTEAEQGRSLWKFCVMLALIFLATEVLLIRFMKG